jgi:parallel beta-helix repeat protein
MKKEVFLIALILSSLIAPNLWLNGVIANSNVIRVLQDQALIQEVINEANPGDTIHVSSGTFYENIVINKTLTLIGANKSTTIIDGNKTDSVVTIEANNVVLRGFTIQNGLGEGIIISGFNKTTIIDNAIIFNGFEGIHLENSHDNTIRNNIISSNALKTELAGIELYNSDRNTIRNNTITYQDKGIEAESSSHNTIYGNTILKNNVGVDLYLSNNSIFYHNNFINNTYLQVNSYISSNTWDNGYPSGGNYWSDYNDTDTYTGLYQNQTGSDGIGDTPYIIDANNVDRFPLMNRYGKATEDITPPTISIATPVNGSEIKSSTITVSWTGSDETSGVHHYEIRLDDNPWINVETNTTHIYEGVSDGNHTINVKAFDKTGNTKQDTVNFIVNTSPLFGPGYVEEAAIIATIIIIIFGTAVYLLKIRKKR